MWIAPLSLIVALQLTLYLFVRALVFWQRKEFSNKVVLIKPTLRAFCLTFLFGLGLDVIAGQAVGIFHYPSANEPSSLAGLSYQFLFFNAALSYTAFSATISILPFTAPASLSAFTAKLSALIIFPLLYITTSTDNGYILVFSCGAVLLCLIELAAYAFKIPTPLGCLPNDRRPFLQLAAYSAFVGIVYETGNLWIKLWDWTFLSPKNDATTIALVVLLGYFVLSYPFFVFARFDQRDV